MLIFTEIILFSKQIDLINDVYSDLIVFPIFFGLWHVRHMHLAANY